MEYDLDNSADDKRDLAAVCRLCGCFSLNMMRIFTENNESNDLYYSITHYLPIHVHPDDQLPLNCCWNCSNTILSFHNLYLVCNQTDVKLKQLLSVRTSEVRCEKLVNCELGEVELEENIPLPPEQTDKVEESYVKSNCEDDENFEITVEEKFVDNGEDEHRKVITEKQKDSGNQIDKVVVLRLSRSKTPCIIDTSEVINLIPEEQIQDLEKCCRDDKTLQENGVHLEEDVNANGSAIVENVDAPKIKSDCQTNSKKKTFPPRKRYMRRAKKKSQFATKQTRRTAGRMPVLRGNKNSNGVKNSTNQSEENDSVHCLVLNAKLQSEAFLKDCRVGINKFQCDQCQKIFVGSTRFLKHFHYHTPKIEFPCDQCNAVFKYKYEQRRHINLIHCTINGETSLKRESSKSDLSV